MPAIASARFSANRKLTLLLLLGVTGNSWERVELWVAFLPISTA
ncbi:hypothetical protein N752_05410 [Desulforamulus aquiferis]|nr:hypothetical protein N752_05410 [Desulforamulus aquiferis]